MKVHITILGSISNVSEVSTTKRRLYYTGSCGQYFSVQILCLTSMYYLVLRKSTFYAKQLAVFSSLLSVLIRNKSYSKVCSNKQWAQTAHVCALLVRQRREEELDVWDMNKK